MAHSVLAPVLSVSRTTGKDSSSQGISSAVKERDFQTFGPASKRPPISWPRKNMCADYVRKIEDRVQGFDLDICPRLLPRFPRSPLGGGLIVFHEAGWQGPVAAPRLGGAAREQNASRR